MAFGEENGESSSGARRDRSRRSLPFTTAPITVSHECACARLIPHGAVELASSACVEREHRLASPSSSVRPSPVPYRPRSLAVRSARAKGRQSLVKPAARAASAPGRDRRDCERSPPQPPSLVSACLDRLTDDRRHFATLCRTTDAWTHRR